MEDRQVIRLKTKFCKNQLEHGPYLLDDRLKEAICGTCGEYLSHFYVLMQYVRFEERFKMKIARLTREAEKAQAKNRCKCEHCGLLTRIHKDYVY